MLKLLLLFQHRMMSYTRLCNEGLSGYVVEHSKDIAKTWRSRGTAAPQIKKESAPKPIWFQITAQTFGSVSLVYPSWPCRHYKSDFSSLCCCCWWLCHPSCQLTLACWKKKKKKPCLQHLHRWQGGHEGPAAHRPQVELLKRNHHWLQCGSRQLSPFFFPGCSHQLKKM